MTRTYCLSFPKKNLDYNTLLVEQARFYNNIAKHWVFQKEKGKKVNIITKFLLVFVRKVLKYLY
jgi:hypothetical protein